MSDSEPTGGAQNFAQLQAECHRLSEALALAERDRQLLGLEIHDDLVQNLAAAALLLENAGKESSFASEGLAKSFADGLQLLRDCIAKARGLTRESAAVDGSDADLPAALARLVEKFRVDQGLPVTLNCHWSGPKLTASVQHLLLRIAQESLFNVWKHARASEVEVRLVEEQGRLMLAIEDNGVGFEPGQPPPGRFGLESIRTRAAILGAELLLDTAPQHGTRIVIRLTAS